MANSRLCTIPDCGKPLVARGLCSGHYQRIQKKGYVRPAKPCSIEGCTRQFHSQGYCVKHYKRYLKYGDPLGGSTDRGAAREFLEALDTRSESNACIIWPFSRSPQGSAQIRLGGKLVLVSRVVCERASGPPPTEKHQAAHLCGNNHLGCIHPRHLEWKTQRENEADKIRHGTSWRSRPHHWRKLTPEQVQEIRRLCATGERQNAVAKKFNVVPETVSQIMRGFAWAWL